MKDFKGKITAIDRDKFKGKWTVHFGLCKSCYMCVEKCPFQAISKSETDLGVYSTPSVKVDPQKCTLCTICDQICPDSAIKVEKEA
ncbi:4Fe-4S binding protein [Candidatus Microgenomates bacterium]|nr:4Fe-4S binding protein [Candidatus Microgenomates bacterium]